VLAVFKNGGCIIPAQPAVKESFNILELVSGSDKDICGDNSKTLKYE
jgi:hypothetical protein